MQKFEKVPGEPLLYINPVTKVYFLRKQGEAGDTVESLMTTKKSAAVKARDDYRTSRRHPEWQPTPSAPADKKTAVPQGETAGDILRFYAVNGYLTEDAETRKGAQLEDEKRNAAKLMEWWDKVPISEIRRPKFLGFKEWRTSEENRRRRSVSPTAGFRIKGGFQPPGPGGNQRGTWKFSSPLWIGGRLFRRAGKPGSTSGKDA